MTDIDEEYWPRIAVDFNGRPLRAFVKPGDQVMLFDPDDGTEVAARVKLIGLYPSGWIVEFDPEPMDVQP